MFSLLKIAFYIAFFLLVHISSTKSQNQLLSQSSYLSNFTSTTITTLRAVVILTFAGSGYPSYLEWSCTSIDASSKFMDMYIFHENNKFIQEMNCGSNVLIIDVGTYGLADMIASTIAKDSKQLEMLRVLLRSILPQMPYFLAEFKPLTGDIFKSYISNYSHWTYSDPDIIWGDVWNYITVEDLKTYDIYTIAKTMDGNRFFLRGQFSLHQNRPRLNNLWKLMEHMDPYLLVDRLKGISNDIFYAHTDPEIIKKKFFVSAEGSYSFWVFQQADLNIKIQGLLFSDKHSCPMTFYDGFLDRCTGAHDCYDSKQCALSKSGRDDSLIVKLPEPVLIEVEPKRENCLMSWMHPNFSLCARGRFGRINEATYLKGRWYVNDEKSSHRIRDYGLAAFHFRVWEDLDTIHTFVGKKEIGNNCFLIYKDKTYLFLHHCNDMLTPKQTFSVEEEVKLKNNKIDRLTNTV